MGFQQGLSGLNAASRNLDVIGNNVANANTAGFKSFRAQFADVFAAQLSGGGATNVGIGTNVAAVNPLFTQGNITTTSNPLDIAINGSGFFRLDANGTTTYSRNGQFQLDKDGYIVNAQGQRLTGYGVDAFGKVVPSSPGDLQVSRADIAPQKTSEAKVTLNLDSRKGTLPASGFSVNDTQTYHSATSLTAYDSLGNAHAVSLYFVKTAANTWDVFGTNDGAQIGSGSLGQLTFKDDGSLDMTATAMPFNISSAVTTGATTPMTFDLDFTDSTQFGTTFGVNAITQDGFGAGKLTGFSISQDGVILGRYTNGQSRAQGQIALADFANPQGLQPMGGNAWAETSASGQPLVGAPGASSLGVVQSGAIEDSNVDLTQELVNMITAQRVYQANAQTIRTQDQVLQTLVNLR